MGAVKREKSMQMCIPKLQKEDNRLEVEGRDSGLNSVPDCVSMKRHFSNIIDPHYLLRPYLKICLLANQ